jgi:hypothetical protein
MGRRFGLLLLSCCVVFVSVSGCQRHSVDALPDSAISNEQAEVFGSRIAADCLVTVFDEQGVKYISQQHHIVYPGNSAMKIQAKEPEGDFEWHLIDGVFTVVKGDTSKLSVTLCSKEIAQAILLTISARGGFIDDQAGVILESISIAGRIYQPILIYAEDGNPLVRKVYRDIRTFDIDWVDVGNTSNDVLKTAKGYNDREIAKSDKFMPTSIDIYDTDKDGRPSDRIMTIEYNSFGLISR